MCPRHRETTSYVSCKKKSPFRGGGDGISRLRIALTYEGRNRSRFEGPEKIERREQRSKVGNGPVSS